MGIAEFIIGRAFARPVGSTYPTRYKGFGSFGLTKPPTTPVGVMRPVTPHSGQGCRQNLAARRWVELSAKPMRHERQLVGFASAFRLRSASYGGRSRSASYGGRAACAGRHRCEFPIQLSYSERMCVRILAARCARALRRLPPSITTRGRRESRVRAAPAVSCANMHKNTHTSIQVQRRHPGLPCAMVYGLLRALPGDRAFLPPSPARSFASRELDTSVGVSGPHGFTVRSSHARQSQLSRPPHPTARS
jgi:hypothetical protein